MATAFPQLKEITNELKQVTDVDEEATDALGELKKVGEGAAKGSVKQVAKNAVNAALDPKSYLTKGKFTKAFGKGLAKGALSEKGGWFGWAKFFWSAKDLKATLADKVKPAPPAVKLFELGYFLVFDVVQPVGEYYIKAQKDAKIKEQLATLDLVAHVYTKSGQRFVKELKGAFDEVRERCRAVKESYDSGLGKKILSELDKLSKSKPDKAEQIKKLIKPGVLKTLRGLRELQLKMYGLNASAYVFSSACEDPKTDNASLGFSNYTGYVHPSRALILKGVGSDVQTELLHSLEQMGRLDKFIEAFWKIIGKRFGLTPDDL